MSEAEPTPMKTRLNPVAYMRELCDNFGTHFVVLLASAYFALKGSLYTLYSKGQMPYYLDYMGTSGDNYQRYGTFSMTPWALKAAIGALSDTVPWMGYSKAPYIILASACGCLAFGAIAFLPLADFGAEFIPALLFFAISLQLATVDVLVEGRYTEKMNAQPKTGASIISWVWICNFSGALIANSIIGPITDHVSPRYLYAAGVPLALQIIVPVSMGYLQEKRHDPPAGRDKVPCMMVKREKIKKEPRMYILAIGMTLGALTTAIISIWVSDTVTVLSVSWGVSLTLMALAYYSLPRHIAHINAYVFICQVTYLGIPGALDPWYTGDDQCVPNGPHFSNTYYITVSGIVGSVAGVIGCCLFQILFKKASFRFAFWTTTIIKAIGSVADVVIVERWHRPYISDTVMYLFGDAVISQIAEQLDYMPSMVLISKVCPPGYESMLTAIMGGFQNFGRQVARNSGTFLTTQLDISANKKTSECNFDKLTLLILLSHMWLPLITIPLTFFFIPKARLDDDLIEVDNQAGPYQDIDDDSCNASLIKDEGKIPNPISVPEAVKIGSSGTIDGTPLADSPICVPNSPSYNSM
eukprot:TRINITY_DN17638_c0_g1_i2.p1 TRINITY_DN17638_c0_g1~~TRINITY_DN17638_c0_g1_i2.p1  ORF type:complete len:583 (+),score=42.17 TRINITY_DN17638_c0_g1_i2:91-1839(+)